MPHGLMCARDRANNCTTANSSGYAVMIFICLRCSCKINWNAILQETRHKGGGKMLCHLVIDLNKKLCAGSDEDETCTEKK